MHKKSESMIAGVDQPKWEPMKVTRIGKVADIVLGGGGKLSTTGGDPGEMRKQKGGEP